MMNWDRIEGSWRQLRGRARERWGELTEDDLDRIDGRREEFVGRIQERYGLAREEADRQVADWQSALRPDERRRTRMDANRETLKAWLRDAHAMERATIDNLERQVRRLEGYPEMREKIREHLAQSRDQLRRVEDCLHRLGADPSRVKDAATRLSGVAEIWLAGAAPDAVVKNCIATYAFEQFEIACYSSLAMAAEACGEPEVRRICEEILEEERAMAEWLREHLPAATRTFLQRQAAGEPARGVAGFGAAVRRNPVPTAALAAAGLGLLLGAGALRRRSGNRRWQEREGPFGHAARRRTDRMGRPYTGDRV